MGCAAGMGLGIALNTRRKIVVIDGDGAALMKLGNFAAVARACGYRLAASCDSLAGFDAALREALAAEGPAFVHMRIAPGSLEKLGRPTIKPHEVARRFRAFVTGD
jgi:phosphonopyruvate decarboxylase